MLKQTPLVAQAQSILHNMCFCSTHTSNLQHTPQTGIVHTHTRVTCSTQSIGKAETQGNPKLHVARSRRV